MAISFEQIQVRDPLAADYMAFISCVKEQDIPQSLLPPTSEFDKVEALGTLKGYGFIKERLYMESYDMHRLVHIAMQNWLKMKDEWRDWNEKTMKRIMDIFPWPKHENKTLWTMYLPHAQYAITNFEKIFSDTKDLPWRLLHNLAQCSQLQGKFTEAEVMHWRILELKETVLGMDHPDTLVSISNLASSLHEQGKYAEAESIYQGVDQRARRPSSKTR
jgi:hypothetical protein